MLLQLLLAPQALGAQWPAMPPHAPPTSPPSKPPSVPTPASPPSVPPANPPSKPPLPPLEPGEYLTEYVRFTLTGQNLSEPEIFILSPPIYKAFPPGTVGSLS